MKLEEKFKGTIISNLVLDKFDIFLLEEDTFLGIIGIIA